MKRPAFSVHRSCGAYSGILKDILILFKYRGFCLLAKDLSSFIFSAIGGDESLWWGLEGIVPVPLSAQKEKERGFNQSFLLAKELAAQKGIDLIAGSLIKVKTTPSQTSLEADDRRINLRGAFDVIQRQEIRGKTVLLIDDVYTTGSTLQECSQELLRAGASEVRALTVAQA
jgi:ComF family protein